MCGCPPALEQWERTHPFACWLSPDTSNIAESVDHGAKCHLKPLLNSHHDCSVVVVLKKKTILISHNQPASTLFSECLCRKCLFIPITRILRQSACGGPVGRVRPTCTRHRHRQRPAIPAPASFSTDQRPRLALLLHFCLRFRSDPV